MKSPLDILLPYQMAWVNDQSRFKIGNWSRQIGKSFGTAAEAVRECNMVSGDQWVVLSAGERQALEWMEKAKQWALAFDMAIDDYREERGGPELLIKSAEIRFPNKSRILAIPANPSTARGYSANLVLDEFAHHEKPGEIWKAIYPSITNPLRGLKKIRIVSTPNGRANKFYDLWTKNPSYSKHKVTILDAIKAGLNLNAEELRLAIDDPDAWLQEYMCEFIDSMAVLLPYDLIGPCETEDIPTDTSRRFVGVDVGRRHDLTVIWDCCQIGDIMWTVEEIELEKAEFHVQFDAISAKLDEPGVCRCAIDSTGIGAMLAEELKRKHGDMVMECTFSQSFKAEIFTNLRRRFEDKTVRIPVNREIREDLHSMQKTTSNSGQVRYAAPRSSDGHADRSTALALCIYASNEDDGPVRIDLDMSDDNTNFARPWGGGLLGRL